MQYILLDIFFLLNSILSNVQKISRLNFFFFNLCCLIYLVLSKAGLMIQPLMGCEGTTSKATLSWGNFVLFRLGFIIYCNFCCCFWGFAFFIYSNLYSALIWHPAKAFPFYVDSTYVKPLILKKFVLI